MQSPHGPVIVGTTCTHCVCGSQGPARSRAGQPMLRAMSHGACTVKYGDSSLRGP